MTENNIEKKDEFVHLHLHTQYSFLDGAIKINELIPRIKELGMNTVAITDHGHMHGVVDFYKQAQSGGIKPIIGCEAYISKVGRTKKAQKDNYHIVLLAKNNEGYKNLMHLVSFGYMDGFYYKPRIDREILRKYSKGIIGLSACLGGMLSRSIMSGNIKEANELALEFKDIFEEDSFYLEIQHNGIHEQENVVNPALIKMSKELNIPLVATNDSHYMLEEHAEAHDILMKIQMRQTISDGRRHNSTAYYIRSPQEMKELFKDTPEAVQNTVKIAQQCNVEIELGTYYLPEFPIPEGFTPKTYFEHVAKEGLKERIAEIGNLTEDKIKEYEERLEFEIGVINQMDFPGYFLIVWDFIKYAKDNKIPVGPGRGSGAGSIVAYSMRITDLNPMPLDLLFERFLNPDRVSMPDFDIDFCQDRRDEVIEYVKNKYGEYKVAQIASFSQLKAKSVVRDVGRVLEIPLDEVNKLAKMIPDGPSIKNLKIAMEENPEIEVAMQNNNNFKQMIEIGKALEGLYRQTGVHAAGIVISNEELWNYTPVFKGKQEDKYLTTQFEKNNVEEVGLVKFDFLGLKTLTVIDKAVRYVNAQKKDDEKELDILKIDIDDDNIYQIYRDGNTDGVFQFESDGMKKYLKELKPDKFGDIIAMNALYRPGPMEYIPDYVAVKHGKKKLTYDHPAMEEYLEETNGITVYQEQVMLLSRKLAGFTRGEADTLRKAMGKKKQKLLDELYPKFVEGCKRIHNIEQKVADKIWADWVAFAKYAFNKSHSACYAYVSLQTAYLKYYHPAEFMAAILSFEVNDTDKIVKHIVSAKDMGLEIVAPNINRSFKDFTVENNKVIFGLGAVKGIGEAAITSIIEERNKNGKFKDFYDVLTRVDLRKVNKKALESLVKSGVFDVFGEFRSSLFNNIEDAIRSAQGDASNKKAGLKSLFGGMPEEVDNFTLKKHEKWPLEKILAYEKEVLGFYISGHPTDKYREEFKEYGFLNISDISTSETQGKEPVSVLAIFDGMRKITTKQKKNMLSGVLQDSFDALNFIMFSKPYEKYKDLFEDSANQTFIVTGFVKEDSGFGDAPKNDEEKKYKFHIRSVMKPENYREDKIENISIELIEDNIDEHSILELSNLISTYQGGNTAIYFSMLSQKHNAKIEFTEENTPKVKTNKMFIDNLSQLINKTGGKLDYKVVK